MRVGQHRRMLANVARRINRGRGVDISSGGNGMVKQGWLGRGVNLCIVTYSKYSKLSSLWLSLLWFIVEAGKTLTTLTLSYLLVLARP